MSNSNRTTRRHFLKTAGALVAAPYFVPARALGRERSAGQSGGRPLPASERITMGFIGVGNMGGGHLPGFLGNKEVQVVAICDVKKWVRDEAAKQVEEQYAAERASGTFKGCETYNEYEKLLARPDIDAVLIAVPDHWHATVAIAACRAGKDVYCEKPLSLTIREAQEMVAAARRYDRVFQVGSQQRSSGEFRLACEIVRSGRLGKIKQVNVGVGGPSREKYLPEEPIPEGLDWDRWLGPAPVQPYNAERCSGDFGGGWRHIRDYSGGMMTDWGAHHFDICQWGLGMDGSGPVEITPPPWEDRKIVRDGARAKVDPALGKTLVYKYASGIPVIHGGANGILFTGEHGKVEVNRGYFRTWPDEIGKEPIGPSEVHLYESPGHQQDWINCIRSRRRPIADVAIGASTITVCHLGNIAYWLGRELRWDPEKREIIGDPEAARWLDRPKRAPWRLHA